MSAKTFFRCLFFASVAVVIILLGMEIVTVHAQCEQPQPSSCTTCHAQTDPVSDKGEWHIIHASKDICINCHGGNGSTMEKDLAHQGVVANPLNDIYTDCHSCHPDYETRAAQFAPTIGMTPGSCATPTPAPASSLSGQPPSSGISATTNAMSPTSSLQIFAGLLTLAAFLFGLGWLEKHHTGSKA